MCHPGTENNHLVSKITWRYMIVTITPCMTITETNCFSSRCMFVGWKALTCTYLSIDIMIILYVEVTNMHHRNQRVFHHVSLVPRWQSLSLLVPQEVSWVMPVNLLYSEKIKERLNLNMHLILPVRFTNFQWMYNFCMCAEKAEGIGHFPPL